MNTRPPHPTDYEAWQRGYMPPSEHILIDELAYRGAKVILSCHDSKSGYWLVFKGQRISPRQATAIAQQIEFALECLQAETYVDPADEALISAPFPAAAQARAK